MQSKYHRSRLTEEATRHLTRHMNGEEFAIILRETLVQGRAWALGGISESMQPGDTPESRVLA
jgi:hypothetical protein